jgi:uncharacterized tellurite resistance protein B-like protein
VVLRRFLGLPPEGANGDPVAADPRAPELPPGLETATVRRIVAELEALPEGERRYLAGFAYLLSRAAHADLHITPEEVALMERTVMDLGGLPEAEAVLAVEIAKSQNQLYGGTEDFLVTREFRAHTTEEQRLRVLRCCFAVGAVDGSISAEEYAELSQIATELGFTREQLNAVRSEFRDRFEAIRRMRQLPGALET